MDTFEKWGGAWLPAPPHFGFAVTVLEWSFIIFFIFSGTSSIPFTALRKLSTLAGGSMEGKKWDTKADMKEKGEGGVRGGGRWRKEAIANYVHAFVGNPYSAVPVCRGRVNVVCNILFSG